MKRTFYFSLILAVVLILAVGCASTVGVKSWVPSKFDLTGYKNVAVQSTKQSSYSYYNKFYSFIPVQAPKDSNIKVAPEVFNIPSSFYKSTYSKVVDDATNVIFKAFNSTIYNVKDAKWTDSVVNYAQNNIIGKTVRATLLDNKIDLIVSSSLDDLFYEEFIQPRVEKDSTGKEIVKYYLYQRAHCQFSYTLQDVRSASIIGSNTKEMDYPVQLSIFSPEYETTLLGTANLDGTGWTPVKYRFYNSPESIFSRLLKDVSDEIAKDVSPYQGNFSISLKRDPNKSEIMKNADKLVSQGQYKQALEIYNDLYETQSLFEAGYNRIVVTFAMGNRSEAETMAYQLYKDSYNENALNLYYQLHNLNASQAKAIDQILGTERNKPATVELIGF